MPKREYRQVVRYVFAPAGVTPPTTNEFYVYVSHYKSGTSGSDVTGDAPKVSDYREMHKGERTRTGSGK
jgi:hypothetical protein